MSTARPVISKQSPPRAGQPASDLREIRLASEASRQPVPGEIGPLAVMFLAESFLTAEEIAEYFNDGRIRVRHGK